MGISTLELTADDRCSVEELVRRWVPPYSAACYRAFFEGCRRAAAERPNTLGVWRQEVGDALIGLVRNMPVDSHLPRVPTRRGEASPRAPVSDAVVGMVCALFGALYTIADKTTDRHIHDVYPLLGEEDSQLGSSQTGLEWHVEDGTHPQRPDWVVLSCLRGDPQVGTFVARARDLSLHPALDRVLRAPTFRLRVDDSFAAEHRRASVVRPVLTGPPQDPGIVFDPAYTLSPSLRESEALAILAKEAHAVEIRVTLRAGDLLVFNNRKVVHGRTAYRARLDGLDRWIKRALVLEQRERHAAFDTERGVMRFAVANDEGAG